MRNRNSLINFFITAAILLSACTPNQFTFNSNRPSTNDSSPGGGTGGGGGGGGTGGGSDGDDTFLEKSDSLVPTISVTAKDADILFVVDASQSMQDFRLRMANAFEDFTQALNQKSQDKNNWRIAVTLPRVGCSGVGATDQRYNGNFIRFKNQPSDTTKKYEHLGPPFLVKGDANTSELFRDIISFNENNDGYNSEGRGINVVNQAFVRNEARNNIGSFFRPNSHHAVVLISDEDNYRNEQESYVDSLRGWLTGNEPDSFSLLDIPLFQRTFDLATKLTRDYPHAGIDLAKLASQSDIITNHKTKFPMAAFTFHSIIWLPNTSDSKSCSNTLEPLVQKGRAYNALSNELGGVSADICASNYTASLESIAGAITQVGEIQTHTLQCDPVLGPYKDGNNVNKEGKVEVFKDGQILAPGSDYSLSGRLITFVRPITAPSKATINYICKR